MKKIITNKFCIYTICFWGFIGPLICFISSIGLFAGGHSDAIWQHYPIMLYVRRLLLNFLTSFINKDRFIFPMVDFTIGMGEDTIAALNYYGLGDPFYLLTVLVSERNLPYFYSVFFYFRVYLGGCAFIAFVSELDNKKSTFAYVIGALVYSFTGFTVQSNMHIIFTHAMFYMPLMLLGVEKSIRENKRGLLCVTTFCFALSGFFFLYIASIALAVYVICCLFREKRSLSDIVKKICGLLVEYGLGLGLSAILFVPAFFGFLSSNRVQIKSGYSLIRSWEDIKSILLNMFQPSYSNLGQETAVCTIGMIVIICVLLAKDRVQEKINLILLFLTTIIPFFNYFMSGFGANYSRWQFIISMYMAFLTFHFWDELDRITLFQKTGIVLVYLLLLIAGKKRDILVHERFGKTLLSYGIILIVMFFILPLFKRLHKEKIGKYILFFVVYVTICINWKAIARDRDIEALQSRRLSEELIDKAEPEEFYRVDDEQGEQWLNISLQQGYYGIRQYVSIANKRYVNAFEVWDISNATHMTWSGLNRRAILETMCDVKYLILGEENDSIVPYGFEYVKSTEDGTWCLYENMCELPIAYTYEKIYDIEEYQKMSGIERQQVMLQAAVVENYGGGVPAAVQRDLINDLYIGTYEITGLNNVVYEDGIIKGETDGVMTIAVDIKSGGENYLFYTGEAEGIGEIEIENSYVKRRNDISPLVVNLGTTKENKKVEITITFDQAVAFNADNLQVIYHDLSRYTEYIDKLKRDTDGRFNVETNNISGTLELEQNKILCISVPYSLGWHAKIDGKEVEIYPVNDLFMGIEVPKGLHEIELYYVTPGIKVGAMISIVSLLTIALFLTKTVVKQKHYK